MKYLLIIFLMMAGCYAKVEPTSTIHWQLVFTDEAAKELNPDEVIWATQNLSVELGLPMIFSLSEGEAIVFVSANHEGKLVGYCGTGRDCHVFTSIWNSEWQFSLNHPRALGVVILHELGHSYGLDHYDDVDGNVMNHAIGGIMDPTIEQWQVDHILKQTNR